MAFQKQSLHVPKRIGIQGIPGAFHHLAAETHFGVDNLEVVPFRQFQQLATAIANKEGVDVGLMAIENSLAGSLLMNYHLIMQFGLQITGEVYLRIRHNLLALPGQTIEQLSEVHSHPMAIEQCRPFFFDHPSIRLVETEDTALSALRIQEKQLEGIGAIASQRAGELYGLEVIAPGIESNPLNYTRFLIVEPSTRGLPAGGPAAKISVCLELNHEVGSLSRILNRMAELSLNLIKIQSVPIPGKPWKYRFFLDFIQSAGIALPKILTVIESETMEFSLLGVYPSTNPPL